HRITGVLTFFFLFVHVLDTALVRVSPSTYDEVIASYKTPLVNLLEVGLVGAVLYHALNGLRVMLVDFWSKGPRYQRQMLWGIVVIWLLVLIPGTYFMLERPISDLSVAACWPSRPPRSRLTVPVRPAARRPAAATSSCTAGCSCGSPAWHWWCWCSATCSS